MRLHTILTLPVTVMMVALCTSCDVHQFPATVEQDEVNLRIHLEYLTDLPHYQTIDYTPRGTGGSRSPSDMYDVRYTLNFYPYGSDTDHAREPVLTRTFTRDDVTSLPTDIGIDLPRGHYRLIVWTDYVADGSTGHLYYNTDDFAAISLWGSRHTGNNDYRDAFHGTADIDLTQVRMPEATLGPTPERPVVDMTVTSERPLAKFNILTTDLDKFISRAKESRAGRARDIKTDVDLNDFRIVIHYPAYMPSEFNAHTGKPSDSSTGNSFDSSIHLDANGNAELGFDYVLVNGSEASVQIALEVYDYDSTLLSSTGTITVPLMRSKLTTLIGEFLTVSTQGGVGIDPSYDGEFNIFIP